MRFVERAGNTILEELGSSNPWVREWTFPRKDCLPCIGQSLIAAEIELEALKNVVGDHNVAENILEEISVPGKSLNSKKMLRKGLRLSKES